ncbi:MAG: hypothetical protein LBV54_04415 [Puniceicoccales bacterium]|jgi:hypothetical protein|nr:hypothetical protein [Puniceicoccales bacterium]
MKFSRTIRNTLFAFAVFSAGAASANAQSFQFADGKVWEINDPFSKVAPNPLKGTIRGNEIVLTQQVGRSTIVITKKFAEVTRIDWPKAVRPKALADAEDEIARGDANKALAAIEPIVQRFAPLKKVPGSLWLDAASIRLDALVLLKNDLVISQFIAELEGLDSSAIPGLDNRIKLAKLEQTLRKGNANLALSEVVKFIDESVDLELCANLYLIKGGALLQLRNFEQAMNAYLSVPVFYGSQTKYIAAAKLGAAKAFRGMSTPANKALQLDVVANNYLSDIIAEYPLSKEAEIAKGMLPKDEREVAAKKEAEVAEAATKVGEGAVEEPPAEGAAPAAPTEGAAAPATPAASPPAGTPPTAGDAAAPPVIPGA